MGVERIDARFKALKAEGRAGLIPFITAGDPTREFASDLLKALPEAGADLIELGMPFSDPMADGPAIQASSLRALKAHMKLQGVLDTVAGFRKGDRQTPIILMGYCNPVFTYGVERFCKAAAAAGVDGLIIVDLPPEEEDELKPYSDSAGLALIRLVAPTTDDARLKRVIQGTAGFVYFISITGITGTKSFRVEDILPSLERLRHATDLPRAVGFGIRTPEHAAAVARIADAVVVGSAIVGEIERGLDEKGAPRNGAKDKVIAFVRSLAGAVRGAREKAVAR
ncbi:MAG TPA: tryptophan synthase subunit alpha [Alphaproteobacteria bacterium]|nr:tryptophan synthase subunit alpha [Alphaproteobacteria bacterium]